ncbi:MAG: serine/threonine-protein phosphatase [bacterium]|nr:serine/threonine-protein phosphatase [bacterium]
MAAGNSSRPQNPGRGDAPGPGDRPSAAANDRIEKFRGVNLARLVYSAAFIGLLYYLDLRYPLLYAAAGLHLLFAVLWLILLETEVIVEKRVWWSGYAPATADVIYVSMWIYLTGNVSSFLVAGYFVSIALSSMTEQRNYGLWTAAMCALCFSTMGVLVYLHVLPTVNILMDAVRPTGTALIITIGLTCFWFLLVNRIISTLFLRLNQEIIERKAAEDHLMRDLQLARKVQESIIPTYDRLPASRELSFGSFYLALESVGGDLYDVLPLSENRFAFLIADVSGHGVPAALLTTMAKAIFAKAVAAHPDHPEEVCRSLNRDMYSFIGDLRHYLTAYYCLLDVNTGKLEYCNAGHHPALLFRPGESAVRELDTGASFFIGVEPDFAFERGEIQLEPGDRLFLFTDGMIEGRDASGEIYGPERFENFIVSNAGLPAGELVRALIADLEGFLGGTTPEDDRAILCIDYRAQNQATER